PDSMDKRAALAVFEPHGALISSGTRRRRRREFNEEALSADHPLHPLAESMSPAIAAEFDALCRDSSEHNELSWDPFARTWWRAVRTIVLGSAARDDTDVMAMLNAMRRDANWVYFGRRTGRRHARFAERVDGYLHQA